MPPGKKAFRAKDEIRTRDPDLGKVVLYQLSYFRIYKTDMLFRFGDANIDRFLFLSRDFLLKI